MGISTPESAGGADGRRHVEGEAKPAGQSRFHTVVICLALLLEGMSSSSINVQVAAVRDSFGLGPTGLGLVAAAFLITYAGLLPTAGRLVDVRDRRQVFLAGVALFGLGCALCTFAINGGMVVAGRSVQGVGAALSAPAALALITHGIPPGAVRNRAVAVYGAMGAAGFSLGLVVPGFVVAALGWRAGFAVLLPVVLVVLVVTWRVPAGIAHSGQRIDLAGAALLTATLMVVVHAIGGLTTQPAMVSAGQGALVVVLVGVLARRGGVAGFPARVVVAPRVLGSCIALAAVFAGVLAGCYLVSLGLQTGGNVGPLGVGLLLLPQPLTFALLSGAGARSVTRIGPGRVLAGGMLLIASALVVLAVFGTEPRPMLAVAASMVPAQVAIGAGLALAFPAASIGAVDAAPEAFRGTTAGLLTTWQNVGGAFGLAMVTALGVVPAFPGPTDAGPGLVVCSVVVVVGGAAAWLIAADAGSRRRSGQGAHRVSRAGAHR